MKLLVPILAPLGDTLFTTPALKALRNAYPEAEIDVLVWKDNKHILTGNDNIDRLLVCKGKGQLVVEIQELRDQVYDYAIGLSTTGSYISSLVNADKKLGFKGSEMNWIYDYNVPDNRSLHAVEYCLEIVKSIGACPDQTPKLDLSISDNNRRTIVEKLKKRGITPDFPLLAIHPGGKHFSLKRWPEEKFKDLIKVLDRNYDFQVVLIGGKDDRKLSRMILDPYHRYNRDPRLLAGELSIKETGALLEYCRLFIGNDSAPVHMAAAVGTPVVALFGPTNPANFYPYGTRYRIIQSKQSCSPCFSWLGELKQYLPEYLPDWATKCKGSCMENINIDQVIEAVEELVNLKDCVNREYCPEQKVVYSNEI